MAVLAELLRIHQPRTPPSAGRPHMPGVEIGPAERSHERSADFSGFGVGDVFQEAGAHRIRQRIAVVRVRGDDRFNEAEEFDLLDKAEVGNVCAVEATELSAQAMWRKASILAPEQGTRARRAERGKELLKLRAKLIGCHNSPRGRGCGKHMCPGVCSFNYPGAVKSKRPRNRSAGTPGSGR